MERSNAVNKKKTSAHAPPSWGSEMATKALANLPVISPVYKPPTSCHPSTVTKHSLWKNCKDPARETSSHSSQPLSRHGHLAESCPALQMCSNSERIVSAFQHALQPRRTSAHFRRHRRSPAEIQSRRPRSAAMRRGPACASVSSTRNFTQQHGRDRMHTKVYPWCYVGHEREGAQT